MKAQRVHPVEIDRLLVGQPQTGLKIERRAILDAGDLGLKVRHVGTYRWELLPGTWRFEVWDGERKLAVQRFNVVEP